MLPPVQFKLNMDSETNYLIPICWFKPVPSITPIHFLVGYFVFPSLKYILGLIQGKDPNNQLIPVTLSLYVRLLALSSFLHFLCKLISSLRRMFYNCNSKCLAMLKQFGQVTKFIHRYLKKVLGYSSLHFYFSSADIFALLSSNKWSNSVNLTHL